MVGLVMEQMKPCRKYAKCSLFCCVGEHLEHEFDDETRAVRELVPRGWCWCQNTVCYLVKLINLGPPRPHVDLLEAVKRLPGEIVRPRSARARPGGEAKGGGGHELH